MPALDIYWSFRSPYSYLAIDRLAAINRDYEIDTRFKPVRPLALREPDFFSRGRKQFVPYLIKDFMREGERLGIPAAFPNPDPIDMDLSTGIVAPDQPIMTKVMGLAFAAIDQGRGIEFAQVVSRSIWSGVENWCASEVLSETLSRIDLDLPTLEAWAAANGDKIKQAIEDNEAAQLELHWGVPLMVLDGEPFFGQDRIDSLIWRLNQLGLKRD